MKDQSVTEPPNTAGAEEPPPLDFQKYLDRDFLLLAKEALETCKRAYIHNHYSTDLTFDEKKVGAALFAINMRLASPQGEAPKGEVSEPMMLLVKLDEIARDYDPLEHGLPLHNSDVTAKMVDAILATQSPSGASGRKEGE